MNSMNKIQRYSTTNEVPDKFLPAITASLNSDHKQHKVGAAVYYKGKFLATGFNSLKTDPSTHWYDLAFSRHAEIHALKKAKTRKFDLTNATVFVYRKTKNGDLAMAKPCKMCMDALLEQQVKEVFYTCENGWEKIRL